MADTSTEDDIRQFLVDNDVLPEESAFAGREADDPPDPVAIVSVAPGEPDDLTQDSADGELFLPALENPRVRIIVRSLRYGSAREIALLAWRRLRRKSTSINGTFYSFIQPMSEPYNLGPYTDNRQQVGLTLRVKRRN